MSRPSLSERIYGLLLRLFPLDFRLEYREEMEELFRLRHRDAAEGVDDFPDRARARCWRLARLWVHALADLARSAPREHWDALRQDLRFSIRGMRRTPGFTALVILTFALAIGANTSIFTVAHATLLRPLPFAEGERLVRLVHVRERPDGSVTEVGLSRRDYHAVANRSRSLVAAAAQVYQGPALRTEAGIQRVTSIGVSGSWFRTLGVEPLLGRTWTREEEAGGEDRRVLLLSHRLWRRHFAADPDVIGRTALLDGSPHTIVGVMPAGFNYPYEADLWRLWRFDPDEGTSHILNVQGRIAPAVSLEEVQAELDLISERQASAYPDTNRGYRIVARPTRENLVEGEERLVLLLMAGVGVMLLIAAANVVSLLLARTVSRSHELAVRASLGASTWRLVRQLVTENVVLALFGGVVGLVVAAWLRGVMLALLPGGIRNLFGSVPLDETAVFFAAGLSVALGTGVGLLAGWSARSIDLREVLHGSTDGPGGRRLLGGTIVVETGLTATLLVGALLLSLDLHSLATRDPGFETANLLTATLSLPEERYESGIPRLAFEEEVLARIRSVPGVEAAAIVNLLPYSDGNWVLPFQLEGESLPPEQAHTATFRQVTDEYFRTLGIPVLQGRALTSSDRAGALPVAVVDRSFADRYWPGQNPLGRVITAARGSFGGRSFHVVGVVGDVEDTGREPSETVYTPMAQTSIDSTAFDIVQPSLAVRTAGLDPASVVPAVRSALEAIDPGVPLFRIRTAEEALGESLARRRMATALALAFGACGLLLAAVGTYGLVSHAVSRGVRSLAIQMAVGADRKKIFLKVLLQGGRLVLGGVLLGLVVSASLSRFLAGSLEVTEPTTPAPYVVVASLLVLIGFAASLEPALRATRTDPAEILREV